MDEGLEITTQGFAELDQSLREMGESLGEKICRKALRDAGNVAKAAIAANAPVRTPLPKSKTALPPGTLQNDITVTVARDRDTPNAFSAWIEPGAASRHVAGWVEWGHRLVKGGRSATSGKRGKGRTVRLKSGEQDVPAHPYIRPAFDENEEVIFATLAETVLTEVNKVAAEKGLNAGR